MNQVAMQKSQKKYENKVYLIGAGPGDAGLLTVKGKEILREADTVIYDALAGEGVLGWIPDNACQIYVGKRSGCHAKSQEEINALLVEEGKKNQLVVRLKGGDPFVFGRGGEEAQALRENGIPFEVVPGITSSVAVPAYFGIPVTHRGLASSFHVITGHSRAGKDEEPDYEALARTGGTLIFLMGVAAAGTICRRLMEAGMRKDMPAAFLQEGTTASQRKVISTLEHLAKDGKTAGIQAPAIMVVGEVCSLHTVCAWAEEKPLFGKRVLVTRPGRRAPAMTEKLRANGAEVVELPSVEIALPKDREALDQAIRELSQYQWLLFTSPSGVEVFFELLEEERKDIRLLAGLKIAVIGRATGEMLEKKGIYPDYMPKRFYAKDLGEGLAAVAGKGEKMLLLRAEKGSGELTDALDKAGIFYRDTALYETLYPKEKPQTGRIKKMLSEKAFDFVTFTSGSTVDGFMETLTPSQEELAGFTAVCIGEQTKKAAERFHMDCIVSEIPSMDSMTECMESYCRERK